MLLYKNQASIPDSVTLAYSTIPGLLCGIEMKEKTGEVLHSLNKAALTRLSSYLPKYSRINTATAEIFYAFPPSTSCQAL